MLCPCDMPIAKVYNYRVTVNTLSATLSMVASLAAALTASVFRFNCFFCNSFPLNNLPLTPLFLFFPPKFSENFFVLAFLCIIIFYIAITQLLIVLLFLTSCGVLNNEKFAEPIADIRCAFFSIASVSLCAIRHNSNRSSYSIHDSVLGENCSILLP